MAVIKYKGTDGLWHMLSNIFVKGINVVQEKGQSTTDVMSQKAVTDAINDVIPPADEDDNVILTAGEY